MNLSPADAAHDLPPQRAPENVKTATPSKERPPRGLDDKAIIEEMFRLVSEEGLTRNAASLDLASKAEPPKGVIESKARRLRDKFNIAYDYRDGEWVCRQGT